MFRHHFVSFSLIPCRLSSSQFGADASSGRPERRHAAVTAAALWGFVGETRENDLFFPADVTTCFERTYGIRKFRQIFFFRMDTRMYGREGFLGREEEKEFLTSP